MNTQIYYFSGTGNSLYVAKKIQEKLGDTELIQMTATLYEKPVAIAAETLGFVFPVYFSGWPVLVETIIKQAQIRKPNYLFVVATNGGGPANTLINFVKFLGKKGLTVDSAFDLTMPGNYVVMYNSPSDEQLQQMLAAADTHLMTLIAQIVKRANVAASDGLRNRLQSALIYPLFLKMMYQQDRKFSVSASCTGCGICRRICPARNIRLNAAQRPEWQQQCEKCMACIQWCPAQAIEYGKSTRARNRYHHPAIKAVELMAPQE
jgi:ferredoxin